jgi:hypothetical protein
MKREDVETSARGMRKIIDIQKKNLNQETRKAGKR